MSLGATTYNVQYEKSGSKLRFVKDYIYICTYISTLLVFLVIL